MQEESLRDVGGAADVQPPHPARLVTVSEGPFEELTPAGQQAFPAIPGDPPSVCIDRCLSLGSRGTVPVPATAIRFREIRSKIEFRKLRQHLIAAISLVRHDLGDAQGGDLW
jgi:hypothetical protein